MIGSSRPVASWDLVRVVQRVRDIYTMRLQLDLDLDDVHTLPTTVTIHIDSEGRVLRNMDECDILGWKYTRVTDQLDVWAGVKEKKCQPSPYS